MKCVAITFAVDVNGIFMGIIKNNQMTPSAPKPYKILLLGVGETFNKIAVDFPKICNSGSSFKHSIKICRC